MSITKILGESVVHKRITPECRQRDYFAYRAEVDSQLWGEVQRMLSDPKYADKDFHIVLTVAEHIES